MFKENSIEQKDYLKQIEQMYFLSFNFKGQIIITLLRARKTVFNFIDGSFRDKKLTERK